MSRAHCLDCGTDVPVDPLGHCPEGHLLPAQGRRVESAIGSDDHHPDEPEPWVAQVDQPVAAAPEDVVPSAEPQAAPGFDPAERETSTGDLLRELGSLSEPDEVTPRRAPDPGPPSAPDAGPPSTPSATAAPAHEPPAPPAQQPTPPAGAGPDPTVAEHSALEQALQSLEDAHQEPAAPVATDPTGPAPAIDDDLSSLFDEFEGLGDDAHTNGSTPAAPAPPPTDSPAAAPSSPPPTAPPPAAAPSQPPPGHRPTRQALREAGELADAPPEPATSDEHAGNGHDAGAADRGLDTMNFTAKGGAMNGRRRRRLLGR